MQNAATVRQLDKSPETSKNTTASPKLCPRCKEETSLERNYCPSCAIKISDAISAMPGFYRNSRPQTSLPSFDEERPFIYIHGVPGSGKSITAAHAAKAESINYGLLIKWQNCAELFLRIRATFKERSREEEADVVKEMTLAELLVLDDIAAEKVSDYSISTLYIILNKRGERQKKTIITSNLSVKEVGAQIDKRIADRLHRYGQVIEMKLI